MTKELDLTYLMELAQMPGAEQMSSDLTPEQREAARQDINSTCNKMALWLYHRGMPRIWLAEYGWPKVLEPVKERMKKRRWKLVGPAFP